MTANAFELLKPYLKKSVTTEVRDITDSLQRIYLRDKNGEYLSVFLVQEEGEESFFLVQPGKAGAEEPKKEDKKPAPVLRNLDYVGSHKQHSLSPKLKVSDISKALPGVRIQSGDSGKVRYEWAFEYKGQQCAIWDYHSVKWSAYGPWWCFVELGLAEGGIEND